MFTGLESTFQQQAVRKLRINPENISERLIMRVSYGCQCKTVNVVVNLSPWI